VAEGHRAAMRSFERTARSRVSMSIVVVRIIARMTRADNAASVTRLAATASRSLHRWSVASRDTRQGMAFFTSTDDDGRDASFDNRAWPRCIETDFAIDECRSKATPRTRRHGILQRCARAGPRITRG